ncbi:dihydrolipoyl dehydrogenase [Acidaminococcus sp. DS4831]|uniref:dihydrolipoyl dehydrogenase n=1 Tax=Acidaminococcus sp. DS4831 TaxID=3141399 RepID=UPI0032E4D09D
MIKNEEKMSIIIIGAGPGGYVAAIRAAQLGTKVTVIDEKYLGGTCLNIGCIPTKCLLHSAELIIELKKRGAKIGVEADNLKINFQRVIKYKNEVSSQLTAGIAGLFKANGIKFLQGRACFIDRNNISVSYTDGTKEVLTADAFIISTGSINAVPHIPGIQESSGCIDSTGALSLPKLPKSMIIIGAGVIGLELACAYAAFGTDIKVIEALDNVLPMLDSDLVKIGIAHMKNMGIEFYFSCPVQSVNESQSGVQVVCHNKNNGKEQIFEAEKVLVAVGRKPNTKFLNLNAIGVETQNGSILVNDKMQTNLSNIYAIGDCVCGKAQLAHTASVMGEVAAENIMGISSLYSEKTNPVCVYIEPEAASVGLTEKQAKEKGIDYIVGKFSMNGNGKSLIMNDGVGLVKIIAGKEYNEILGMHIIGPRASDLIAEGALAIEGELTLDDLINTIHSHPTVTEAIREAALDARSRAIHMPPKNKNKRL